MRVGITLPQFRHEVEPALDVARRAEDAGLDGVFVFDHLWPLGQPVRPALHSMTLLGALAAETGRVTLAPLVARVGLVPDTLLVHQLATLHRMVGDRLIAALGTGDTGNRGENEAYGIRFAPVAERLASVQWCARRLGELGVRTWIGGRSAAVRAAVVAADAWNGWGTDVEGFVADAAVVAEGRELTWGGQVLVGRTASHVEAKVRTHGRRPGVVTGTVEDLVAHLRGLAAAGATWAVCAPIDVGTDAAVVEILAEAAAACR